MKTLRTVITFLIAASLAPAADFLVYVGTYTSAGSKGIYSYRFRAETGKLTRLGVAAATSNPSFLVVHPNHRFLYAVNEGGANTVSAFEIEPKGGKLSLLGQVPAQGDLPCHLAIDQTGKWLAVANYGSGTMAIFPIGADGKLGPSIAVEKHAGTGPNKERQEGPHAHAVVFSPDNRFLLLADLGLDKIFVYRFNAANGSVAANDPPSASVAPGAGVRHLAFHPNGTVVYAINELDSTVAVFEYDAAKGTLNNFQTVPTLPDTFKGVSTTAEIAVNAAGTMAYASNRGHDSIAMFNIDPERFTLAPMGHAPTLGRTPRHFAIDPTGAFLFAANQDSHSIAIFRVDPRTGQLAPFGKPFSKTPTPVCILFVPMQ